MTCISIPGGVVCVTGGEPGRAPKDPSCWCSGLERSPDGYRAFVEWSEDRMKTHRQLECPDCGDLLTLPRGLWARRVRTDRCGNVPCPACGYRGIHNSPTAFTITGAGRVYGKDCDLRSLVLGKHEPEPAA